MYLHNHVASLCLASPPEKRVDHAPFQEVTPQIPPKNCLLKNRYCFSAETIIMSASKRSKRSGINILWRERREREKILGEFELKSWRSTMLNSDHIVDRHFGHYSKVVPSWRFFQSSYCTLQVKNYLLVINQDHMSSLNADSVF